MRNGTRARMRGLVHDALRVIEQDLGGDLALDDVARNIATSRRSLQRAFEGEGITFREAVAAARMRRARALLQRGGLPIYQVADRVGYRSKAEFTKAFKRHTGVTPSDYARTHRDVTGSQDLDARRPAPDAEPGQILDNGRPAQSLHRSELHA
jgi:AraC family transcriptional regulator of adaptative response / methylphosphotriester-DNA alkyltransferase methyltransferase